LYITTLPHPRVSNGGKTVLSMTLLSTRFTLKVGFMLSTRGRPTQEEVETHLTRSLGRDVFVQHFFGGCLPECPVRSLACILSIWENVLRAYELLVHFLRCAVRWSVSCCHLFVKGLIKGGSVRVNRSPPQLHHSTGEGQRGWGTTSSCSHSPRSQ
jgi:hypothetical protein